MKSSKIFLERRIRENLPPQLDLQNTVKGMEKRLSFLALGSWLGLAWLDIA